MATTGRSSRRDSGSLTPVAQEARPTPSEHLLKRLQELSGRLVMPKTADDVWHYLLTHAEQTKLGTDFRTAVNTHGWNAGKLYRIAKDVTPAVAVLEVSRALGMMLPAEYTTLRQEVDACEGRRPSRRPKRYNGDEEALVAEINEARMTHDLVVVAGSVVRAIYWKGAILDVRWEDASKSWALLLKIARACARGVPVDAETIASGMTQRILSNRKLNLKRQLKLPSDFVNLIRIRTDRGVAVSLDLPKERLRVFEVALPGFSIEDLPQ